MNKIRIIIELIGFCFFIFLLGFLLPPPDAASPDVVSKYPSNDSIDVWKPYRGEENDYMCPTCDCGEDFIFDL